MNFAEQNSSDVYNQVRIQQNLGTPCEDCGCEQGHKIYCCVFVRGARSTSAFYNGRVELRYDKVNHLYFRVNPEQGNLIPVEGVTPDTVGFLRRKLTHPAGVPAVSFTDVVFSAEDVLRLRGLGVKE